MDAQDTKIYLIQYRYMHETKDLRIAQYKVVGAKTEFHAAKRLKTAEWWDRLREPELIAVWAQTKVKETDRPKTYV